MKGNMCWLVMVTALLVQNMWWVSASSRYFGPDDYLPSAAAPALQPGGSGCNRRSPQAAASFISKESAEDLEEKVKKIGSSRPSCNGKCYGCSPCKAIQVPTITSRVGLQHANYEPEGWKCKCGPVILLSMKYLTELYLSFPPVQTKES